MAEQKTEAYGFYKTDSGYLINKDTDGLLHYKKQKAQMKKIKDIESDIHGLKSDMQEIKDLLIGLVK